MSPSHICRDKEYAMFVLQIQHGNRPVIRLVCATRALALATRDSLERGGWAIVGFHEELVEPPTQCRTKILRLGPSGQPV